MLPKFLLPESVVRQDGVGPEIAVDDNGSSVLLTLGITRIIEQESLDLTVWGSSDGQSWQQLMAFPQKFYCGAYSQLLNLKVHPKVAMLRAQWKVARWGRGDLTPLFGIYLFAESAQVASTAGA